jgi:ABC-type transport system involved in cytochrome c biogenesis permease component
LVLTYVAALAFAVASGLGLLWTLVMPLLSPVLYLTVKLILDHATREKSKPVPPPNV